MTKYQTLHRVLLAVAVVFSLHIVDSPDANAELFRRRGRIRRPFFLFNRPVFRPINRRVIRVNNNRVAQVRNNAGRVAQVNNGNGRLRIEDLQRTGFARIKLDGGNLVEEARFSFGGGLNRLFIDRNGRLIGARDPQTLGDLRSFYSANLNKFSGQDAVVVRRFLQANGGNTGLIGTLVAGVRDRDGLSMGVSFANRPGYEKYANYGDVEIRTAALSFLMNSISGSCNLLNIKPGNVNANGNVVLDQLDGFVDRTRLTALLSDNPYSCGDARVPARTDWLASQALQPRIYNSIMGLSDNLEGLGQQLGVKTEQRNIADLNGRKISRILVKGDAAGLETGVGVNEQRVLERQTRRTNVGESAFYRSYDFTENNASGPATRSADVLSEGIQFDAPASEIIFTKCNGFLGFYLNNAGGGNVSADSAPAEVAIDGSKSVVSPDRCFKCHANGFLGGAERTIEKGKPIKDRDGIKGQPNYTDHFAEISKIPPFERRNGVPVSFHSQFFSPNSEYALAQKRDSARFKAQKILSGAHLQDPEKPPGEGLPVLFDLSDVYRQPLTLEQAAKELGTKPSQALANALQVKKNQSGDLVINRTDFERKYCLVRAALVRSGGASVEQFQQLLQPGGANHSGVGGVGGLSEQGGQPCQPGQCGPNQRRVLGQ